MRKIVFKVEIEVGGKGENMDILRVEEMLSLDLNDLMYDDEFASALDAEETISSTVTLLPNESTILDK
jgi:hypothetical protein